MASSARVRLAAAVLGVAVLAILAALLVANRSSGAAEPTGGKFAGSLPPPNLPPVHFRLHDQDGKVATLDQYRGRFVLITFLYTHCKDTCPIIADQIRAALDDLGSKAPPAITISVDPTGDTAQSAKAFLLKHHLTGRMRYLIGTKAELQPVWKAYGIQPQTPEYEHSAYVFLLDKQGSQVVDFAVGNLTPENVAHDVRLLERGVRPHYSVTS